MHILQSLFDDLFQDVIVRQSKKKLAYFLNHCLDFYCFFKMIKRVFRNPPSCRLHEQFGIIIFICKERVKGQAHVFAFIANFSILYLNNFSF